MVKVNSVQILFFIILLINNLGYIQPKFDWRYQTKQDINFDLGIETDFGTSSDISIITLSEFENTICISSAKLFFRFVDLIYIFR